MALTSVGFGFPNPNRPKPICKPRKKKKNIFLYFIIQPAEEKLSGPERKQNPKIIEFHGG